MGFDPLVVDNWYNTTRTQIVSKGNKVTSLLNHYGYKDALKVAYPELDFQWSAAPHKST